ncbi:MAG: Hsp70 family protein [Bacteroidia bacterium]|nr:Hsp70 family protein [Bacteroidia bacterium]
MIPFGIDLGTTNSALAFFHKGEVKICKHPISLRDTLPSVIAFRKGKIIVGDKAREYILQSPNSVISSFKRKMGTTESWKADDWEESLNPIQLSAFVLQELKTFVQNGAKLDAAVITIPASFDTIQSNATKEAGFRAGFSEVRLLQEPIAASLAYANQDHAGDFEEGQWLVYDLGGGTFDVALVKIQDGEMRIIDHEGDNFLGGDDFNQAIVEKLVVPEMEKKGKFKSLKKEMKSASGKYNALYLKLLRLAEDAKHELSTDTSSEIEFSFEDNKGKEIQLSVEIKREAFEELIEKKIKQTLTLTRRILKRNQLKPADLKFVLMVGGSTYIPYVREQVAKKLKVEVNTQADPTTVVAVGAAFYGASLNISAKKKEEDQPEDIQLKVKMAYEKASKEKEEYFIARFEGETEGLFYRIQRLDGGFDTGLVKLDSQIQLDLPLVEGAYNEFSLQVFDAQNNAIVTDAEAIGISQGKYAVVGQPLPNDICIEIDDVENNTTILEVIFEKNTILPAKKTIVKQISRTIAKGSSQRLTINILEGPSSALPATTQPIGFISITGEDLNRDLVRGSDVEISLEISESRDLSINTYLMMTDQEYEDQFNPTERRVNLPRLVEELYALAEKIRSEIAEAEAQSNFETAQELVDMEFELLELADNAREMSEDDITDNKYQIEDQKRKLAQKVDELTREKQVIRIKNEYFESKRFMEFIFMAYPPKEEDQDTYQKIISEEKSVLATNSSVKIRELISKVRKHNWKVRWKHPRFIREFFKDLAAGSYGGFTHPHQANELIREGNHAMQNNHDEKLRSCINRLCELLPADQKKQVKFGGTGLN